MSIGLQVIKITVSISWNIELSLIHRYLRLWMTSAAKHWSEHPRSIKALFPKALKSSSPKILKCSSPKTVKSSSPKALKSSSPEILKRSSSKTLKSSSPKTLKSSMAKSPHNVLRELQFRMITQKSGKPQWIIVQNNINVPPQHLCSPIYVRILEIPPCGRTVLQGRLGLFTATRLLLMLKGGRVQDQSQVVQVLLRVSLSNSRILIPPAGALLVGPYSQREVFRFTRAPSFKEATKLKCADKRYFIN